MGRSVFQKPSETDGPVECLGTALWTRGERLLRRSWPAKGTANGSEEG